MTSKFKKDNGQKSYLMGSVENLKDQELEKEILACLIHEYQLMKIAYGRIINEDFIDGKAGEIFTILSRLYEQGHSWDLTLVRAELKVPKQYNEYLFRVRTTFGSSHFELLIEHLRQKSAQRYLYEFLNEELEKVFVQDPKIIATESLDFLARLETFASTNINWKIDNLIEQHKKLMKDRTEGKMIGVTTGFKELDYMLGNGFQRKDLIILGARPSVGKTSFALTLSYNAVRANNKVLFLTLEMDEQEVFDRLLSFETKIPVTTLARGNVNTNDLKKAYKQIEQYPLSIMHIPKADIGEVHAIAAKYKYTNGLDMIVVDYLGYISDRGDDEVNALGRITKGLKTIANTLNCVVLSPHQLSRKIERRSEEKQAIPLLSDLRDSGHIEQDADVVMFLNREILGNDPEKTILRIGKHRTGSTGIIDLKFNSKTTQFLSL